MAFLFLTCSCNLILSVTEVPVKHRVDKSLSYNWINMGQDAGWKTFIILALSNPLHTVQFYSGFIISTWQFAVCWVDRIHTLWYHPWPNLIKYSKQSCLKVILLPLEKLIFHLFVRVPHRMSMYVAITSIPWILFSTQVNMRPIYRPSYKDRSWLYSTVTTLNLYLMWQISF